MSIGLVTDAHPDSAAIHVDHSTGARAGVGAIGLGDSLVVDNKTILADITHSHRIGVMVMKGKGAALDRRADCAVCAAVDNGCRGNAQRCEIRASLAWHGKARLADDKTALEQGSCTLYRWIGVSAFPFGSLARCGQSGHVNILQLRMRLRLGCRQIVGFSVLLLGEVEHLHDLAIFCGERCHIAGGLLIIQGRFAEDRRHCGEQFRDRGQTFVRCAKRLILSALCRQNLLGRKRLIKKRCDLLASTRRFQSFKLGRRRPQCTQRFGMDGGINTLRGDVCDGRKASSFVSRLDQPEGCGNLLQHERFLLVFRIGGSECCHRQRRRGHKSGRMQPGHFACCIGLQTWGNVFVSAGFKDLQSFFKPFNTAIKTV
nr:MAG TPA: hypothetical protein [Caudoviricetes sp.]